MKTAFLFPGQGAQFPGMARDLYERFPEARERLDRADEILGFSLTALMFGEQAEPLRQTDITQPALFAHSLAVCAVLEKQQVQPDMGGGHSLGEYSALTAAGALSFEDGLQLVKLRGRLMHEAGQRRSGTMAALLGMEDEQAEKLCEHVTSLGGGLVQPANYNSPGQIVISGDTAAVERAVELAKEWGAKKAVPLVVGGAFHSLLMEHARDGLAEALARVDIQVPRFPVYLNVTASPSQDPKEIRQKLLEQLMAPVRWAQSLVHMHRDGARRFVEVGSGAVLTGLARRTLGKEIETQTKGTVAELA